MNLPTRDNDPLLLRHEPLRTHISMYERASGNHAQSAQVLSCFIEAMQNDGRAASACMRWASLVFNDALSSNQCSLLTTDDGKELYKVFFEYQYRLYQGLQKNYHVTEAPKYRNTLRGRGIRAINLVDPSSIVQRSIHQAQGSGAVINGDGRQPSRPLGVPRQKKNRCQAPISDQHSRQGLVFPLERQPSSNSSIDFDTAVSSSLGHVLNATADTATKQEISSNISSGTIARLPSSTLSEAVKKDEYSAPRMQKKRKPSSQKPPVTTPSDSSGDDKVPLDVHENKPASSVLHRPKRIAVVETVSVRETKTTLREDTSGTQSLSSLLTSASDSVVPHLNKSRCGATSPPSRCHPDDESLFNVPPQRSWSSSDSKGARKMKYTSTLPTRASWDSESRGVSISAYNLQSRFPQEPTAEASLVSGLSTQQKARVNTDAQRRQTRPELEAGLVLAHETVSLDLREPLGPDITMPQPLPRKLRTERFVLNGNSAIHGAPCSAPFQVASLKHGDQLLQDGAESDTHDWTQDNEHALECDDLDNHDRDTENDVQVTNAALACPISAFKPPVPAPPHIWAQSRQEVCESFDHFRSYHGGVYSKGDIVKGYLLGAYASSRDLFHHGGKLIISHGGGKSESILDTRRGPKRYQTDQDQQATDKSVRALLRTCRERRPLVLLADDKYALFPYDLASRNYTYVVLGLYWISRAWAECQSARDGSGRVVRWKFAFQWCEGQGNPWWDVPQKPMAPIPNMCVTETSSHLTNIDGDASAECESCHEQSPFIYNQGWMCLNPTCNVFWTIDGKEPEQLDYHEEFLRLLPQTFERLPDIVPPRIVDTPGGVTTIHAFSKGWHCAECGRLSCRYKWEHWECSNCASKHVVNGRIRSPKEFWSQVPTTEFIHSRVDKDSGIVTCRPERFDVGEKRGFTNRLTFILPRDSGRIHLILGTPISNGDANCIFQMYQQQAATGELKLRRYPLRNHRARGQLLTNYFSQNSGEPYQYVGGTGNTVPFEKAPECVRRALAMIKERSSIALRTDIPFNEILSAAYMERQKMAFHSDSEKGLGPVVASLSLGSAALMHFRPHLNAEVPKGKGSYALTLVLRHGDVLIMDGDGVQKNYEHTVIPVNFRIAATARCIGST